ncbi:MULTISPECIES: hypothetical protein [unclassified Streptomyces]|uniref:hypothetical protein n=1 Tax=unclassified Streptomyces TaxID=2593676 RepID=UPI0032470968
MPDDFESVLRTGSSAFAERTSPKPVGSVRAHGDRLRRRRSAVTTVIAVAAAAGIGGAAFAMTGLSHNGNPATPPAATHNVPPAPAGTSPAPEHSKPSADTSSHPASACRSLVVPQEVKNAVTKAYLQSPGGQGLAHIEPAKGTFYYGTCDGTTYAATRFTPAPGATLADQVGLQDEGAAMKYFTQSPQGGWTYVASNGFPADPRGCAAIPQIPAGLATAWGDCLAAPTAG